jgi:hypothetical protein
LVQIPIAQGKDSTLTQKLTRIGHVVEMAGSAISQLAVRGAVVSIRSDFCFHVLDFFPLATQATFSGSKIIASLKTN